MALAVLTSERNLKQVNYQLMQYVRGASGGYGYRWYPHMQVLGSDATAQLGPLMARPRILSRSFGFGSWAELIVYG